MRPRRLPGYSYSGPQQYFLTLCTFERRRHFVNGATVSIVNDQFLRTAVDSKFAILAYCFMPDHLHLLVEGMGEESALQPFVSLAKQRSGFAARAFALPRLWQTGYFERVLRGDDDAFNVARYVVQNPVRAGLVRAPDEYPFTGSSILSKDQLIGSCQWNPRQRWRP